MTQFDPERPPSSSSAPGPDAWSPRRQPPQQWSSSDQGGQPREQWPSYPAGGASPSPPVESTSAPVQPVGPPSWTLRAPDAAAQQAEWSAQSWQPVPGAPVGPPPPPVQASDQTPGQTPEQTFVPAPTTRPLSAADQKTWSVLAHAGVPLFGVISAGLIYFLLRDRGPFIRANAAEALNWSIVYTVATVGCAILTTVVIGAVLWPLVFVAAVVFGVLAAIAAGQDEVYPYPFTWRLAS